MPLQGRSAALLPSCGSAYCLSSSDSAGGLVVAATQWNLECMAFVILRHLRTSIKFLTRLSRRSRPSIGNVCPPLLLDPRSSSALQVSGYRNGGRTQAEVNALHRLWPSNQSRPRSIIKLKIIQYCNNNSMDLIRSGREV